MILNKFNSLTTYFWRAVIILVITAFQFYNIDTHETTTIVVNTTYLENHVETLAAIEYRNHENIEALNKAAEYIKKNLQTWHYKNIYEHYYTAKHKKVKNLYCIYGDTTLPRLVLGAHYDVCENQPGADDNASGVAGLLEIARLLQTHKPALKNHCVEMAFYTLEEPPFFRTQLMGSYQHAQKLHTQNKAVKLMISMEMIGYYSEVKKSQDYPIGLMKLKYPSKGNYIAVVSKNGMGKYVKQVKKAFKKYVHIPVESLTGPAYIPGVDFSDHMNFWIFNFPAIMITDTAFLRNKHYHEKTDTPEKLNYIKMAEVVKGIYYFTVNY